MASITPPNILQEFMNNGNDDDSSINGVINRQDIRAAIAKTMELRALHAALMQAGDSPAKFRLPPAPSPVVPCLNGQDYPVFTPTYKDEPLPAYQQIRLEKPNSTQSWVEYASNLRANVDETTSFDDRTIKESFTNELLSRSSDLDQHVCPAEDQISVQGSSANNINVLQASPAGAGPGHCRRKSMGDFNSISSCNKCKPALISIETEVPSKHGKISKKVVMPLTTSQHRNKGLLHLPRLFPRRKKKNENENERSPLSRTPRNEEVNISIEALKKELMEANESKEAALMQVEETKTLLTELSQKLECLESYCQELKNTLIRQEKNSNSAENMANLQIRKSMDHGDEDKLIKIEGFLQIVLQSRLSVTQFCKTLLSQVKDSETIVDNLNLVLGPYKLSIDSYTSEVQYHLEAFINQSFYQDFDNRVFRRNGAPKLLDPQQDRQARVESFLTLKNLTWNDVLRKGTKCYSEELSNFCDQKMSGIIAKLGWTKPWPEQLLQAFFDAAKGIWLLHLLALSFNPQLEILRVEENRPFDPHYMDDVSTDGRNLEGPRRVKIMLMPGFYLHDKVLKCKVLCRCMSVS